MKDVSYLNEYHAITKYCFVPKLIYSSDTRTLVVSVLGLDAVSSVLEKNGRKKLPATM